MYIYVIYYFIINAYHKIHITSFTYYLCLTFKKINEKIDKIFVKNIIQTNSLPENVNACASFSQISLATPMAPCASFLLCMSSGNRVIRNKLSVYIRVHWRWPLSPGRGFPAREKHARLIAIGIVAEYLKHSV